MRNNSESISELLFAGIIKKVIELATPAHGRPTNEQSAIKRILLGSVSLYLQKGQYTEAARLLDTSRRAIAASTAIAIDELSGPLLQHAGKGVLLQLKAGFLKTRGLERSMGLFCKTPAAETRYGPSVTTHVSGSSTCRLTCFVSQISAAA